MHKPEIKYKYYICTNNKRQLSTSLKTKIKKGNQSNVV